jgi:hypothetical protein
MKTGGPYRHRRPKPALYQTNIPKVDRTVGRGPQLRAFWSRGASFPAGLPAGVSTYSPGQLGYRKLAGVACWADEENAKRQFSSHQNPNPHGRPPWALLLHASRILVMEETHIRAMGNSFQVTSIFCTCDKCYLKRVFAYCVCGQLQACTQVLTVCV